MIIYISTQFVLFLKKSFKYYNHSALLDQSFYLRLRLGEAWLGVSRGELLDKTKGKKHLIWKN